MTNIEKYNRVFVETFGVDESELAVLRYKSVPAWDSVGQMTLISEFEVIFDIAISPDDFMMINSYEVGKKILADNYQIKF